MKLARIMDIDDNVFKSTVRGRIFRPIYIYFVCVYGCADADTITQLMIHFVFFLIGSTLLIPFANACVYLVCK